MAKYYITSAIPYVNAKPHIGHALEFVQADTIARYHRSIGDDTLYLCGSDENALKNVQAAEKDGIPIQEFVNKNTKFFVEMAKKLYIHFDVFQQGSNQDHHASSQKLWELCSKNGDIYKKAYQGLYCVGCETFYSPDELNKNGECFEHPGKKLEEVKEENYFFKLSAYKEKLIEILEKKEIEIVPAYRTNEVISFLKGAVQDISISRSNERAKNWGVPVPGDTTQRIYVWFDALNIYQSGIGFGLNEDLYKKWWPADLQLIGKGIVRFHAVYWPAFLLSAGLKLPKKILVHEYITVNGQKMSKTLGNVIDPLDMVQKYGADALRYYCLAKISPFQDGDFSEEKLVEAYNSDLANGLGNLVARVAKLCETNKFPVEQLKRLREGRENRLWQEIQAPLEQFRFNEALDIIWGTIKGINVYINRERPWQQELSDANQTLSNIIIGSESVISLLDIAECLQPFLPETSNKILKQFSGSIKSQSPLFPRI